MNYDVDPGELSMDGEKAPGKLLAAVSERATAGYK